MLLAVAAATALLAACDKPKTPKVDAATEQAEALERARKGPYGAPVKAYEGAKAMDADLNKKVQDAVEKAEK
jgi:hypothetical protein